MTQLPVEAEESLTAAATLAGCPSANAHTGTRLVENALRETGVNDVVLNCSSLPGAAGSCPRPGLYDSKARS